MLPNPEPKVVERTCHQEVGDRQRDEEEVGELSEIVVGGDGDADEDVADDGGGDEGDEQHSYRHQLQVDAAHKMRLCGSA